MNAYSVTVNYESYNGQATSLGSMSFMRYANTAASAISTVTALFGALSNYVFPNGDKALHVRSASATLIVESQVSSNEISENEIDDNQNDDDQNDENQIGE